MPDALTATIVLAIAGWVIVHILSTRRDRKKEWREFARDTAQYVAKIEKDAIEYHSLDERNIARESKIKHDINQLDMRMTLIRKKLSFPASISFFRAAITLNNFETRRFVSQGIDSEILQDISRHANRLIEELYKAE